MANFTFGTVPQIRLRRSRFDLSHGVKTTANVGDLIPFDVQEVYAGDTFKVHTASVIRLTHQYFKPIMDNMFLDMYYFFVPSRILYDKFANVFGENTGSAWANTVEYTVPVTDGTGTVVSGSIADYMHLPVETILPGINILPFRAYAKIYDDWFRDQNNIDPIHIQTGERVASESFNGNPFAPNNYFGMPAKVSKFHDYFTSCLPSPQKGDPVDITVGQTGNWLPLDTKSVTSGGMQDFASGAPMALRANNTGALGSDQRSPLYLVGYSSSGANLALPSFDVGAATGISTDEQNISGSNLGVYSQDIPAVTVNDLRFAFAYQKMLERDARSGTRYVEYLQSHFGVSAGDYRLQRSEFLGGKRTPLTIQQVVQTTGSDSESAPLAQVGAFSWSNSRARFTKGFVEHGYVIGVFCIRQFHTYQQGVEKFWLRSKRSDFYDPVFANIGEQPVYQSELYATSLNLGDTVFGYNEAWADLRCRISTVTGQMRTGVENSLDIWHLADYYKTAPTLSDTFLTETPDNLDHVITVPSTSQHQFILDIYINNIAYRSLPTYSVPSLIDHN